MNSETENISVQSIRTVIEAFIQARLQLKLDKLKPDQQEEREKLLAEHEKETWLSEAAKRVSQLQQVTHALKYTHPDAKGSNLLCRGNVDAGDAVVGTHVLDQQLKLDVVGNAAALDVNKFLKEQVGGESLLSLAVAGDERLRDALSDDRKKAEQWMQAFAELCNTKGAIASHTLAKQVYWPLANNEYHILAPLFPTSLVSYVSDTLRTHRFSEEAQAARKARKEREFYEAASYEYPNLVVQKYGGTKPQNISQLNSERYGENHLLASVPPRWHSTLLRPPVGMTSVFDHSFGRRRAVRDILNALKKYLFSVKDYNTVDIRAGSLRRIQNVIDEFMQYSAEIRLLESGWSLDPQCRLPLEECLWLDQGRVHQDEAFAAEYVRREWPDKVAQRFANWLNARLSAGKEKLPFGENEAQEWQRLVRQEIHFLREVEF